MLRRKPIRKKASQARRTDRRLSLESLEPRQMLSASRITTDHYLLPFSGATSAGYTPAQIRTAYGFNSVAFGSTPADGRGQTIAIIDAYNDPNITSGPRDIRFTVGHRRPRLVQDCQRDRRHFAAGNRSSQGWEGETALDVEWAHAIAPGANILLVEATSDSDSDLFAAVNYAREQAGVSVISMSWGSDDNAAYAANDQSLANKYLVTPAGHPGDHLCRFVG